MRDYFYDGQLNHRNWDEVREKYSGMASEMNKPDGLARVVSLMLGELNGSHLGFSYNRTPANSRSLAASMTAHLGLRFDRTHGGPGLKIAAVVEGGGGGSRGRRAEVAEAVLLIRVEVAAHRPRADPLRDREWGGGWMERGETGRTKR